MAIFQNPDNDNIANSIPGPISILWLMKYLIATSQLSRTVSQRAEKTGRTKYFEKAYIQTFSHNSLNFRWGVATCQTERLHLFYCINGDWMYFNLHVDYNQEKSSKSNLVQEARVFFKDVKFNKNITLYRKMTQYLRSSQKLCRKFCRINSNSQETES